MKYRFSIIVSVTASLLSLAQLAFAQQGNPDVLVKKFDAYRKKNLLEKVYVHLDQNFYLTGETLWFKVYNVDGSFHKPLDMSKVAYIELLDKKNVAVLQTKISLAEGNGAGSLFLPATIQSGNYLFRCYTNWMKNFSPEYYFQKNITIINPFVMPETEKSKTKPSLQVDFFPEGGYLVNDLQSKVAFKVNNFDHHNSYKGALLNVSNDTIVTFYPGKSGLGSFNFTPVTGQQYRVFFRDDKGNTSSHIVPLAKEAGYVMSLSNVNGQIKVNVSGKFKEGNSSDFLYLFIHSRNIIHKAELKYLQSGVCQFIVDVGKLPEGISHFTILDQNQAPICERLYFKQPVQRLNINTSADHDLYGKRKKVTLTINTALDQNEPVQSNLSIAVHKIDSLGSVEAQNIFQYLWLTSDLNDPIEFPGQYFNAHDTTILSMADDLMLTHGWRKFNWDNILSSKISNKYIPEYRGHLVRGKVTKANDSVAVGALTYLSVPGKITKLYATRSGRDGELLFEVSELQGQHKLILQPSPDNQTSVKLQIENPFSTQFSSTFLKPFTLAPSIEKALLERSVAMQVQDVYYEEQAATVSQTVVDSVAFFGQADETYYLDKYTRFPVMEEVMREYVPGVFVRKRKDGFIFLVGDAVNSNLLEDPMILLDGVPLFDADKIMAVDPRRIRKLEVVKRKYYLGPLYLPGIVSYTSYQGDIAGLELDPGTVSLNYEGLQLHREFNTPRYETQKQLDSRVPDRRFLLYWNPTVKTNKEGVCNLEFYTSDVGGMYEVIVEGMTANGDAASKTMVFSVK